MKKNLLVFGIVINCTYSVTLSAGAPNPGRGNGLFGPNGAPNGDPSISRIETVPESPSSIYDGTMARHAAELAALQASQPAMQHLARQQLEASESNAIHLHNTFRSQRERVTLENARFARRLNRESIIENVVVETVARSLSKVLDLGLVQIGKAALYTGKWVIRKTTKFIAPEKYAAHKKLKTETNELESQESERKVMMASLQQSQMINANNLALLKQKQEFWEKFVPRTPEQKKIQELALSKISIEAALHTGIKPNELAALSNQDDNKSADNAKLATSAAPKLASQPAPANSPAALTLAAPAAA